MKIDARKTAVTKRKKTAITFSGKGLTRQSEKDDCDINKILDRYVETGVISGMGQPQKFGYASELSYTESMQIVADAQSQFEQLPSEIRTRFENKPEKFLAFVENEENRPEMAEMGLMAPDWVDPTLDDREPLSGDREPEASAKPAPQDPTPDKVEGDHSSPT